MLLSSSLPSFCFDTSETENGRMSTNDVLFTFCFSFEGVKEAFTGGLIESASRRLK